MWNQWYLSTTVEAHGYIDDTLCRLVTNDLQRVVDVATSMHKGITDAGGRLNGSKVLPVYLWGQLPPLVSWKMPLLELNWTGT